MKSVDKLDHPDLVGGVVWSTIELDWIRNRDKEWEQQLATQAEQIEVLELRIANYEIAERVAHKRYLQLAASQAENLRLREALDSIRKWEKHSPEFAADYGSNGVRDLYRSLANDALSTPPGDQSALREVIAQCFEDFGQSMIAESIRSGEWTPEALR